MEYFPRSFKTYNYRHKFSEKFISIIICFNFTLTKKLNISQVFLQYSLFISFNTVNACLLSTYINYHIVLKYMAIIEYTAFYIFEKLKISEDITYLKCILHPSFILSFQICLFFDINRDENYENMRRLMSCMMLQHYKSVSICFVNMIT